MVIGDGMIAKCFHTYHNNPAFVIFASGVSNSAETREEEYEKEYSLLKQTMINHSEQILVYFSTCSIDDPSQTGSKYIQHKLTIEDTIIARCQHFYIFRLPQLVGKSDNPYTLTNYLNQKIKQEEVFKIWTNSIRYLLDIEDAYKMIEYILHNRIHKNSKINIAPPYGIKIIDIVHTFEMILRKKASYTLIEKGSPFTIDTSLISNLLPAMEVDFKHPYTEKILKKYYSP